MGTSPKYNDIQKKAKHLVEEGLEFLRAGVKSAEVVAGKTVEVTKLHYTARRFQIDLYRALHDLGRIVYEQLTTSAGKELRTTTDLLGLYGRVRDLEKKIVDAEKDLAKTTVVARPKTPSKMSQKTKRNHTTTPSA